MIPEIIEKRKIILIGMDFFGNPLKRIGILSGQNEIGLLWKRFNDFYQTKKGSMKHLVSESGYEVWIHLENERDSKNKYVFVGVEVEQIEDLPLELVAKILPETRYAVFTLKGREFKAGVSKMIWDKWLPEAGLNTSFDFMIEYHDRKRFRGLDNPDSELDLMVPIL
ncbi:MAG TPA: GyrI-like domain-containing protein [Terriglobales bacterium]|nr:GyrI-like domain-containing protein [Terriglobales bacterium]